MRIIHWLLPLATGLSLAGMVAAQPQDGGEAEYVERYAEGDPARGEKLYRRYCRGCHGEDGRGGAHTFMPHIQNLTKKDYIEFLPDSYLFTVIAQGGQAVGKSGYMPAWEATLSEADIKDVIAHIRALPTY